MKTSLLAEILLGSLWNSWRRWVTWTFCLGALLALGAFRTATDAELALASLAVLPVLLIAWLGGRRDGLFIAVIAAAMWTLSDLASDRSFSEPWVPWANSATRLMTYCIVAALAAKVREQFQREHEGATKDALTGLTNRRAFVEAGEAEAGRARRYSRPMAVAFIDLDDFKQLNDSRGHDAGDAALRAAATALVNVARSSDMVARLGGDEFAVLLPETGHGAAADVGRKLISAVNSAMGPYAPVKASVGVASFAVADPAFAEMLKAADSCMYEAKQSRRGDVVVREFTTGNSESTDAADP